jgi:hypothetical protein
MNANSDNNNIDALVSEADELLNLLNSGLLEYMEDVRRTQIERYADKLKKGRVEVAKLAGTRRTTDYSSSSEGMHEAFDEIVEAMKALKRLLN